jgi:hypothetical protein
MPGLDEVYRPTRPPQLRTVLTPRVVTAVLEEMTGRPVSVGAWVKSRVKWTKHSVLSRSPSSAHGQTRTIGQGKVLIKSDIYSVDGALRCYPISDALHLRLEILQVRCFQVAARCYSPRHMIRPSHFPRLCGNADAIAICIGFASWHAFWARIRCVPHCLPMLASTASGADDYCCAAHSTAYFQKNHIIRFKRRQHGWSYQLVCWGEKAFRH